jgi:uncharacterized membrane protein YhaH (DUF805 family)
VQGSFEAPPIVVKASPLRGALALGAAALVDTVVAGAVVAGTKVDATLFFYLGFFGLCGGAGLWMLMAPARLVIGPEGLTERVLGRAKLFAWSEVYDFRPAVIGLASRTVGFSFAAERPGRGWLRRLNRALSGVEEQLNAGWEIEPAALAELLNAAREHWLESQPAGRAKLPLAAPPIPEGFAGARMNRQVFAAAFAWLVAAAGALTLIPEVGDTAWILVTLFGVRLYAARLHDIGRSGWWQAGLYAAQACALVAALARITPLVTAFEVAATLQLAAAALLCALPGDRTANHFGPAPGQASPLVTSEAFR